MRCLNAVARQERGDKGSTELTILVIPYLARLDVQGTGVVWVSEEGLKRHQDGVDGIHRGPFVLQDWVSWARGGHTVETDISCVEGHVWR